MKFGTAFITGIFISISALFFFRQEEKLFGFLSNKEAVNATTPGKDSSVQKKKPTALRSAKKTASVGKQPAEQAYAPLFFPVPPPITAVKTVDKTTAAANDILNYTITITNNSGTDATDLTFSDDVDPNTTVVPGSLKTSPIAANDNYTALGNVGMSVPDANGILSNDALGTNLPATFSAVTNAATTQGGTISINANGGINYTPPAGLTGDDTYSYTLSNDAGSSTATITITVSGMIWFINNNSAAATADGRLNTPFKTVTDFQAVNDGAPLHPAANHNIFVHESTTPYSGNITLLNGQKLIGQDASASLATITGYTGYTYSTSLLPAMDNANATNTILSASGATNVVALNGGGSGSYTIRGLTIGDKATGSGISGSTFGTLNVSEASITGTGQALNLTTGALSATFASVSSSSGTNAVSLTGITGSLTMGTGSLMGSTGATFNVSGGTVNITYSGNITQANNAAMVNVAGSHTGTITFQTGTLSATNGTGLQFNAANGTYNFSGTNTLNGGDAGVDIVGTSTGGFTFSTATSITNPSGTAFNIGSATAGTGGSGNVNYNGTISKNNAGKAVEIQNKTAGTVSFTGSISSTSTSSGINLASNTGATINFTGGLSLNTSTNTAFNATGGGTISATQNNSTIINTITTTTGIGLNVASTTIGASGLTFRSINVNGATKAVSLNTTGSGGFAITGTGTTAGSGGTIQNISTRGLEFISANNINLNYLNLNNANTTDGASPCDDNGNSGCNAAIYISTATNVSLTKVDITTTAQQGANLNNVTGLTISNCTWQGNGNGTQEGALKARNILGTSSITNSIFKNAAFRIAHIINTTNAATATHLTIDGCTFTNDAFDPASPAGILKQDCFEMRTQSTAVATVIIKNSTFQRAGSYGIQMAAEGTSNMTLSITNCTVDRGGQNMAGIAAIADGSAAVMNANVDGNPLIQSQKEVGVNVFSGLGGTMQATVRNNASPTGIQGGNNADLYPFANVYAQALEQSNNKVLITGNKVEFTDEEAIQLATHDGTTNSLNATVDGNTVITQNTAAHPTIFGVRVVSNTLSASTSPVCANVKNNALTLTNASTQPPFAFEVETGAASSQINLQSNSGTNQTNITNLWVNNSNTPTNAALLLEQKTPGSTINYGGVTCTTPTNLVLPTATVRRSEIGIVEESALADMPPLDGMNSTEPEFEPAPEKKEDVKAEQVQELSSVEINTALALTETTTPDNVTVSGITLPPAKTLTIKFQVTVNDPIPDDVCSINNQGSVSGSSISTVLTDNDGDISNGINPTTTQIPVAPSITVCQSNITANTDEGLCTSLQSFSVTAKGCPAPTITYTIHGTATTITSPYAFPIGTTTVDVSASNGVGSDATCQFTVTINNAAPVITSVSVPANGYYKLGTDLDFTVIFNAAVTVTGTPYIPLTIGSTARNASYVSGSGTTDLLFRYTVANTDLDNDGITVGAAINANGGTIQNSCNTNAILTLNGVGSTTGVLVDGIVPTVTINQAVGQADPTGGSTIHFTVVFSETVTGFATGNVSLSGTAGGTLTGTVTEIAPMNGTTYDVAVTGMTTSGTVIASITANVATDAAGNANTASTSTDNTVTWVACQITPPSNITVNAESGQCGAVVNYTIPEPTGNCGTLTGSPASGSFFPVGTTTVTISSDAGPTSSFTVTVVDDQDPEITFCPGNQTVNTDPDLCTASVALSATASDNCPAGLEVKYYIGATEIFSPYDFPKGTTTVTVKAIDGSGNDATCSFTVTVNDTEKPNITCPQNITVNSLAGQCGASVNFTGANAATATDNCGTATVTYVPASGSFFSVGTTTVTATATDGSNNTQTCTFTVTVIPTADLTIVKTASPSGTVVAGTNVTYTLTVDNNGACDAANVSLSDALPSGTTFVSLTAPAGWIATTPAVGANGTVTATIPSLAAGSGPQVFTLVVTLSSGATGTLANTASITSETLDPNTTNNNAMVNLSVVSQADLNITKTASPTSPQAGTNLIYTIIVTNNGPSDAANVSLSDALPSGTTFVSLTAPAGWIATTPAVGANGTVTATIPSLAAGSGPQVFTLVVAIDANTAHGTILTNTATVVSSTTDPVPGNNSATNNTTVNNCVLTCPGNITAYTGAGNTQCGTVVNFSATATSGCGTVTYSPASGSFFPVGTTTVTATATNTGQTCTFTVTVVDNTPPVTDFNESQLTLWPPNHKLVQVATFNTTDNCGMGSCNVTVVSNEADNGTGDGDTGPDYLVDYQNNTIWVRAERGNKTEQRKYDITLTCQDVNGNTITKTKQVIIAHNITAPVSGTPFKIGSTVSFAGVFWDKPGNKHTAQWLVDGTAVKGTVTEPSGTRNGKVTGNYKFNTAGVYKLQMNVTDQNRITSYCNTNEDLEAIVVIYDPNGGYAYGGGHFASPAGALRSNLTATGLVSYGFTVNYYKGSTYPKGETQFEFKIGEFEYNALNFDYLSISGAKAQFKGSGKIIGGQSGINFIMTVTDGQLDGTGIDKVRIKIYNKNTGQIYYDNEPGTSDAASPVTKVGPNSTVTISSANIITTKDAPVTIVKEPVQELYVTAMPNPSINDFNLSIKGGNLREIVTMQVFDGYGRLIDVRKTNTESTLVIGERYRPGTYYVRFSQGKLHKEIKLIKLPD